LLAIVRHDRAMRPAVLLQYPELLGCAEVERRAPPGADAPTLALYAHEALLSAIGSVAPPATRAIAEAALCSTERYEGLQIKERLAMLPGVSRSAFKERREQIFEHIIRYLTQPTRQSHAVSTHAYVTDDESAVPRSPRVPQLAATLHYVALLPLFTAQLTHLLSQLGLLERAGYDTPISADFNRFVFDQYMAFISIPPDVVDTELAHLPELAQRLILRDIANIGRSTPLGTRTVSAEEASELKWYTCGVALESTAAAAVDRLYETKWFSWYTLVCQSMSGRESALVPVIAATGALLVGWEQSGSDGAEMVQRMRTDARRVAHKLIGSHYPLLDVVAPIAGTLSTLQRLDAFMDLESADLTDTGKIWRIIGDKIWDFIHDGTPFQSRHYELDE